MTGVEYNTQEPMLPFEARYHLRWRADDLFGGALEWGGMQWDPAPFGLVAGDVAWSGSFLELRVARADIGMPTDLELHMSMLRETMLDEASWAAVPSTSFVDGYDPDYAQFFAFDLEASTTPASTAPM